MNKIKTKILHIALPTEHGSWGFVLEPLILALFVAYSFPGLMISLCTFFMFLSHQPIKILFKKNNHSSNDKIVFVVLGFYFFFIATFFSITFFNVILIKLIPFGLSLIVMVNYLTDLYRQKNRELVSELSAPVSISLIALSIVLFKGWQIEYVIAFWFVLLARSIPTTFYVHTKLMMFKKKEINNTLPLISTYIFTGILLWTSMLGFTPYLTVVASFILLIRTHIGIFYTKGKFKVVKFGIMEFIYGGIFIVITTIGYLYSI